MSPSMDPNHSGARNVLRVIGPTIALVGLGFMIVGFLDLVNTMRTSEPPYKFWCFFVGMPLLFVGFVLSKFAFLGAVSRYTANEVAPVGKDVVNYMARGTKDAIRDVAGAIGTGLREGTTGAATTGCPACHTQNNPSARFCTGCGAALAVAQGCPGCGTTNASDSRFCENCGRQLV